MIKSAFNVTKLPPASHMIVQLKILNSIVGKITTEFKKIQDFFARKTAGCECYFDMD